MYVRKCDKNHHYKNRNQTNGEVPVHIVQKYTQNTAHVIIQTHTHTHTRTRKIQIDVHNENNGER